MDGGWPRSYKTASGGDVVLYQPQIASWPESREDDGLLGGWCTPAKAGDKPVLGTVKVEADTKVSVNDRLVNFSVIRIVESNFPTLEKAQLQEVVATVGSGIPQEERVIALDRVLSSLNKSEIMPKNVEGVKADPPTVFFSKTAAVLVNLDGDPIWSSIASNDLQYAINTNWDLFQHGPTKTFYLRRDENWLKATTLEGPWTPAGKLPESFSKLPADENFAGRQDRGSRQEPGTRSRCRVSSSARNPRR